MKYDSLFFWIENPQLQNNSRDQRWDEMLLPCVLVANTLAEESINYQYRQWYWDGDQNNEKKEISPLWKWYSNKILS